jgi:hypothetical protein
LGSKVWSRYPDYNINIGSKIWVVKFGLGCTVCNISIESKIWVVKFGLGIRIIILILSPRFG